jgi:hypothetical protein
MKQLLKYDPHSSSAEYADYIYHFAICEDGLGGFLRVTLNNEPGQKPSASLDICINNESGDELIEESFEIERDKAAALINVYHGEYDVHRA